jgi:hypothetical protein
LFLQEFLLDLYRGPNESPEDVAAYVKILLSAEVSERDRAFYNHFVAGRLENWWDREDGSFPHFDEMWALISDQIDKASL